MPPPPAVVSLNVITAVLLAIGGFGGLVAFLKYPRDNDRVIVSTAEGLHTIQSGIIDQLQEEIGRIRTLRDQAEAESERCRKQIDALESQIDELKREMREYRRSIG